MSFYTTFGKIFVIFIWLETLINEVVIGLFMFSFPNQQLFVKMFSSNYLFSAYGACAPSRDGNLTECDMMERQCRHQVNFFIRFEGMLLTAMGMVLLVGLLALTKLAKQYTPKAIALYDLPLYHLIIFCLFVGDLMHLASVLTMVASVHETMYAQTYISYFTAAYRLVYLIIYVVVPWLTGKYDKPKTD